MGYVTLDQLGKCGCARCNTGHLPLVAGHCVDIDGDYWHDCAVVRRALNLDRCRHCGKPPEADGDHSCPCPHRDDDCPDHPIGNEGDEHG